MRKQNVEIWTEQIKSDFLEFKERNPEALRDRLSLSWSIWSFGIESISDSCERLANAGLEYVELAGNHVGDDLGYSPRETRRVLEDTGLTTSGTCGLFSSDNDLSSNVGSKRQAAIDYLKREIDFAHEVGGHYVLIVPGAVGRPVAYDDSEFARSVDAVQRVADRFVEAGIRGAVEPIRAAEASLVRTVHDAIKYVEAIDHPGIQHINGDVFHIQSEERFVPFSILEAGDRLLNLHLADSNRRGLGQGSMDIDSIIMALYMLGHNRPGRFTTFEPLGPGADSYVATYSMPDQEMLDDLVNSSVSYFREREDFVRGM